MSEQLEERGPINYVVVEFPGNRMTGEGFEGVHSGLLGQDDLEEAAEAVQPCNSAGLLIYENVWAAPFAAALRHGGAQMVASGRLPVQAVLASLEAAEAAS